MIDENDDKTNRDEEEEQDDSINEESSEDAGEFDDSFGLPDVDYKPLDETDGGEEAEPGEEAEEAEETGDYGETDSESPPDFEEELIEDQNEGDPETGTPVGLGEESKPVSTYVPPEQPSMLPKILLAVLGVLIIAGAVWYFGFYKREQAMLEKQRQEQLEAERIKEQEAAAQRERERQEALAREQEEMAAEEAGPEPGEAQTISERDGRYYVVVASFFDGDLAADYAGMLSTDGVNTMILSPPVRKGFYRVALSGHATWNDAQSAAEGQKGQYGEAVWVLKY